VGEASAVEATAEELQPVQVPPVRPAVAQHLDAAQLSTLCHPLQRLRALLDAHTMDPAQAALCRAEYLTSLRVRPDLHVTIKLAALGYLAAEGTSPRVCRPPLREGSTPEKESSTPSLSGELTSELTTVSTQRSSHRTTCRRRRQS
jgi:hypothetical protein